MKSFKLCLTALLLTASVSTFAAPVFSATGKLVGAGQVDDAGVSVEISRADAAKLGKQICNNQKSCLGQNFPTDKGKTMLWIWCDKDCVDDKWLEDDPESEGTKLKKRYINQKVRVQFTHEMNHDRIVGPGETKLLFLKKLNTLK